MRILFLLLINLLFITDVQCTDSEEQVVVYGQIPGPDLWKISDGDNTLYILATLSPLPKKLKWDSNFVELVIKDSQALLLAPEANAEIGFFKRLSLISSVIGIKKNPEGKKLVDVLPQEVYLKWKKYKKLYIGNSKSIEKSRPIFAAFELFQKAIKKIGLKYDIGIEKKVNKLAKRHKLSVVRPTITLDIDKPKAMIKEFKKSEINDLECLVTTMERLEVDLDSMALRANAWANGNITQLKELKYPDQNKSCGSALLNNNVANDSGMTELPEQLKSEWIKSAKELLNQNKSTFAILPITRLYGENNYLEPFKSDSKYSIHEPK